MTYKISPIFFVFIAHFVSVGVFAQSPGRSGGFSELQSAPVAGSHDLEATMGVIQREGISSSSKHYHPGGEFGYVIEGSITISTEQEPNKVLNVGDSFYQPPGAWHVVSTGKEGAKTLVFRILKGGQPVVVLVE